MIGPTEGYCSSSAASMFEEDYQDSDDEFKMPPPLLPPPRPVVNLAPRGMGRGRGLKRMTETIEREESDATLTYNLEKLESLLLADDENDNTGGVQEEDEVLLLDAGEEGDAASLIEEAVNSGIVRVCGTGASVTKSPIDKDVEMEGTSGGEKGEDDSPPEMEEGEGGECQMKWLRTVGFENGKLQCTVKSVSEGEAGALDTLSDSEHATESLMADTIRGMIDVYHKRRGEVLDRGIVATPLHVVKKLSTEHGETMHCEVVGFPNGCFRVEIFSGTVRGVGEGSSKKIAAQMAAIDLLEGVQLSGGAIKVPMSAFLPGWLTNNKVFGDLIRLCESKELPRPRITSKTNNVDEDGKVDLLKPPFRAECWVGEDLVTCGESENENFARREAAKLMYGVLAEVDYKDTPYAIGRSCRRANELKAAGFSQIMSDYKKGWLLQNRVVNNRLQLPVDEAGLDDVGELEELEKDVENLDKSTSYALMKKKRTIKVTVKNKKRKLGDAGSGEGDEDDKGGKSSMKIRKVAVQAVEDEEEDGW